MVRSRIKREPLEEVSHLVQNAATHSTAQVKQEPTDTSTPDVITAAHHQGSPHPSLADPRTQATVQAQHRTSPSVKPEHAVAMPSMDRVKSESPSNGASASGHSVRLTQSCFMCKKADVKGKCTLCNNVFYCSSTCQLRDWSRHQLYCSAGIADPRPDGKPALSSLMTTPPQQAATPQHLCLRCKSPNIRSPCSECNRAYYCSVDCQARDWLRHESYCHGGIPDPGHDNLWQGDSYDAWGSDDELNHEEMEKILELVTRMPKTDVPPEDRKKAPRALACDLFPAQRIGLTWLIEQEKSPRRGGILADAMGLGKTIQSLSLVLAHPSKDSAYKTTLIVTRLALVEQWKREIEDKVKPGYKLKTVILRGTKKKSMTVASLLSYDVVLTTYGTIAAEYTPAGISKTKQLILPSRFHRIILDEAHHIKNDRSKAARAVSAIRATYRLCLTGTPIQNNVRELYSLVKFLRIAPYDDWKRFNTDLAKPLKGTRWQPGSARALQAFLRTILLRRVATDEIDGKKVLELPELTIATATAEFTEDQQEVYNALEHRMQLKFNKYLRTGTVLKNYSVILVLILRLRQCCCHPYLTTNHGIPEGTDLKPEDMVKLAFKLNRTVVERVKRQEEFICPMCEERTADPIIIHPCGHHLCGECFTGLMLVRDTDRSGFDDDDAPPLPDCPSEGCQGSVDPCKVLCHSFFVEAHVSTTCEAVEEELHDSEDSPDEVDDGDEDDDLDGFIVADNDIEYIEDEQESDDEVRDATPCAGPAQQSENMPRPALVECNQHENTTKSGFDTDSNDVSGKPLKSAMASPAPQIDELEANDSDSDDDLPEIGVVWQRAGEQLQSADAEIPPSTPKRSSLPFKRTAKRSAGSSAVKPKDEDDLDLFRHSKNFFELYTEQASIGTPKTKSAVKTENIEGSSGPSRKRVRVSNSKYAPSSTTCIYEEDDSDSDDESQSTEHKRKRSKGKGVAIAVKKESTTPRKRPARPQEKRKLFTSAADLKAESNKSAAAKQRYLRRLRKEYESSAKIDKTMELLREIRQHNPQEKTLIFSVFTSFLDLLEIPIQDAGYRYCRYDGSMRHEDREYAIEDFMRKPEVKIMLVSLRAGNAGINLQAASQVIILDPFWNPSIEDQAIGRAHRLGQKKPVMVHKVLTEATIEDRIVALQEQKRALVGEVLNNEAAQSIGRLSVNELAGLFGIGVNGQARRRGPIAVQDLC